MVLGDNEHNKIELSKNTFIITILLVTIYMERVSGCNVELKNINQYGKRWDSSENNICRNLIFITMWPFQFVYFFIRQNKHVPLAFINMHSFFFTLFHSNLTQFFPVVLFFLHIFKYIVLNRCTPAENF